MCNNEKWRSEKVFEHAFWNITLDQERWMRVPEYLDGYSYIFHLFGIWKSGATYKTAFLNRKYNTFVKSKKKKKRTIVQIPKYLSNY